MKKFLRSSFFFSTVLIAVSICPLSGLSADSVCTFVELGTVFRIDIADGSVSKIGNLHVTAPDIDVAPDGLIWGRADLLSLSALDPDSGATAAQVALPQRPYAQIITPGGKLYVCHNTLTNKGFSMSIVDTGSRSLIKRIHGIQGLVTDLAQDERYVYVAALGVKRPDYLYLYRIDLLTDEVEEIYRLPKSHYRWEIASNEGKLHIVYIGSTKGEYPPLVEVMDMQSCRIVDRWHFPDQVRRILAKPSFHEECAYLPLSRGGDAYSIVVFDRGSGRLKKELPLGYMPGGILGIHKNILVYSVDPGVTGESTLQFYHIYRATEIHSVTNQQLLQEATP